MDDILLVQLLKKKGIISDRDIHELHELTTASMTEPIYMSEVQESMLDSYHTSESKAKDIVARMYHIDSGRKYIGEKFDMYKSKEIYERYKGILPVTTTVCDVYIAINAQYHDYCALFKAWFNQDIESKIIESAINFWFRDSDYKEGNKVYHYFKEV